MYKVQMFKFRSHFDLSMRYVIRRKAEKGKIFNMMHTNPIRVMAEAHKWAKKAGFTKATIEVITND